MLFRSRRALLATTLLAQGTPMLCAGDEIGNSQGGNNNAYCQDNPTTWLNWTEADGRTTELVAQLLALRAQEPLLRHPRWFASGSAEADGYVVVPSDIHLDLERPYYVAASVKVSDPADRSVTFYVKDLSDNDAPLQVKRVEHAFGGTYAPPCEIGRAHV